MSNKSKINKLLKSINIPELSYGFSDGETFPKVVFFLLTAYHRRLSNNTKVKHYVYQINVYDHKAHDIETSEILTSIENVLENNNFNVSEWQEEINILTENKSEFMYSIEVYC